jgi:hypothetical protein
MIMSNQSGNNSGGGIGFVGLLTILFIGLKLTNNIEWSWWWVLSPIWVTILILLVFFGALFASTIMPRKR